MDTQTHENEEVLVLDEEKTNTKPNHALILHNDDVNSFEKVIELLMKYCGHEEEQAYQCALITHHNGKCSVKNGSKKKLRPIKEALEENQLTCSIE